MGWVINMGIFGNYRKFKKRVQDVYSKPKEDGTFIIGQNNVRYCVGDYVKVNIPINGNDLHIGSGEIVAIVDSKDGRYFAEVRFMPWLSPNWKSGSEWYDGAWLSYLDGVDE